MKLEYVDVLFRSIGNGQKTKKDEMSKGSQMSTDNDGNGGNKRLPYMKFDKPGDFTVRLVGNHVNFYRHWQPFTERVISHIDYNSHRIPNFPDNMKFYRESSQVIQV